MKKKEKLKGKLSGTNEKIPGFIISVKNPIKTRVIGNQRKDGGDDETIGCVDFEFTYDENCYLSDCKIHKYADDGGYIGWYKATD